MLLYRKRHEIKLYVKIYTAPRQYGTLFPPCPFPPDDCKFEKVVLSPVARKDVKHKVAETVQYFRAKA